ncbi:hypothetical protein SK128_015685 [Halocaridina rubra]|uniref:Nucleolar protein 6 n=1 Tax=Halocaridina rubra TaxID=373956 RepID=A0AAN9A8C6_HALRR
MDKDSPYDVPSLASLHNLYEVVFMDTSGLVNMMANLLTEDFLLLKHEATLALHMLNSSSVDSFEFLFMKNVEFYQAYDQILSIRLKKRDLKRILEKEPNFRNDLMDSLGDLRQLSWSAVLKLLKRGLGDRVKLLVPARGVESVWSTDLSPPKLKSSLMVGFVINQIASKALLTRGPSADDPGCEAFRNFWGKKSNLRRFQDGSFHEAVLWGDSKQPVAERRLFPGLISKYLLNLHYGLKKNLHYICSKTESVLQLENVSLDFAYGTGEEATFHVIQAYDGLTRKLRSLDLPLKITSVQSVSDVNRHTRVFPPLSRSLRTSKVGLAVEDSHLEFLDMASETPLFNYAIKVNVFLETSGKWPDDLIAIQAIKAEFYKTMASLLKKDKINVVPFPGLLQILWEGFVFHVKVCYRREIYLSRLVEKCEGILREEDTNDAIALEQQLEILPRLNTALASVQADHSSFGCGVRLAKRWLGSQLLLPHIPHIAVELLIAHLCTSPAPYDAPHTPHILFLRFLSLLATTDWKTTPILLNLRDTFSVEDVTEIHRRFTSERSSLPEMFIATAYELRGLSTLPDMEYRYKLTSFWTEESPSLQILYRCKQLASASLNFCTRTMLKPNADIKTIFRPCLNDFDVIMKLHSSQLSRREEALDQETFTSKLIHPYKHHSQEIMPVVMFDPAQLYLEELRDAFDHLALFFHDEHGGDIIGVVWRPTSLKKQELKIANYEGHQLTGIKNTKQIPNMEAILSDFEVMGMGLVQRITVNNKA